MLAASTDPLLAPGAECSPLTPCLATGASMLLEVSCPLPKSPPRVFYSIWWWVEVSVNRARVQCPPAAWLVGGGDGACLANKHMCTPCLLADHSIHPWGLTL